jgi:hypothetical protein
VAHNLKTATSAITWCRVHHLIASLDSDRRVRKQKGTAATVFVYDAGGMLAAEYSTSVPGQQTLYLSNDHLGSTRLTTSGVTAPSVVGRDDYLAFGESVSPTIGSRNTVNGYAADLATTLKFTGKERDAETGLDYFGARYMSSAQGPVYESGCSVRGSEARDPADLELVFLWSK